MRAPCVGAAPAAIGTATRHRRIEEKRILPSQRRDASIIVS
jgi:hypothetical protein